MKGSDKLSILGREGIIMTERQPQAVKCIFCENTLRADTKPEHVLHNALGGRKTTKRVICSDCNNLFGSGIDKSLVSQTDVLRNLLQMRSGTGNLAPTLRSLQTGSQTFNAHGDGTLEPVVKPFTVAKLPNGSFDIRITAASLGEISKIVPNIAAIIGIQESELRQQLAKSSVKQIEQRPGPVLFNLSFGGEKALRSAAKCCLVLWTLEVGNNAVRDPTYGASRDFVMRGGEIFCKSRCALDSRPLKDIEILQNKYGPVFNLVYVHSDERGRVIGYFSLFNFISMRFLLAESGGLPNLRVGLVSNPIDPKQWSDKIADNLNIQTEWLDTHKCDTSLTKERFSRVMQIYARLAMQKEAERIIMDVCGKRNIKENDAIPASVSKEIISEMSDRLTRHLLALPFEHIVSSDQLKVALGGNMAEADINKT